MKFDIHIKNIKYINENHHKIYNHINFFER